MEYRMIEIERRPNGVWIVTLNNPKNLNALGVELSGEIDSVLKEFDADAGARVAVLKGAGRAFSSGGNLAEMRDGIKDDPAAYMDRLTHEVYGAIKTLLALSKPVVAQVHGFAYGAALNMVVACDLSVVADDAVFCESFVRLGLIPGGYATLLLPQAVGMKRTVDLCLTAREVGASEALELGLISRVAPAGALEAETMKIADQLASAPPLAIRETKRLLRESVGRSQSEQSRIERETQVRMARTADFKEGIDAFFEKRKPQFKGE